MLPIASHSPWIAGPPLRRIAPATPPPSCRSLFAALTIASTSASVRSPCRIDTRDFQPLSIGAPPYNRYYLESAKATTPLASVIIGRRRRQDDPKAEHAQHLGALNAGALSCVFNAACPFGPRSAARAIGRLRPQRRGRQAA